MKRQHPTDPNLFWCPKCQTYKAMGEFWKLKRHRSGLQSKCKKCQREYDDLNPLVHKKASLKYSQSHLEEKKANYYANRDAFLVYWKKYRKLNPHKYDNLKKVYSDKSRMTLNDCYIKRVLKQNESTITTETIELKRQAITIKRIERSMINELAR